MQKKVALLIFCLLFAFAGCGYTTRSMISSKFRTIYITPFVNKIDITKEVDTASKYRIYKPLLETDITRSVANRFLWDGNLRLERKELADLVLKGELVEFRRDALRYTQENDEVEEYRLSLVVNISLWDNKENQLIWEAKNFVGDTTYFTLGPSQKSEDIAIKDAVEDLSRRIVERTVEQW